MRLCYEALQDQTPSHLQPSLESRLGHPLCPLPLPGRAARLGVTSSLPLGCGPFPEQPDLKRQLHSWLHAGPIFLSSRAHPTPLPFPRDLSEGDLSEGGGVARAWLPSPA